MICLFSMDLHLRIRRSLVNLSGLLNALTKVVTECTRPIKNAICVVCALHEPITAHNEHCTGLAGHGRGHFLGKDDIYNDLLSMSMA